MLPRYNQTNYIYIQKRVCGKLTLTHHKRTNYSFAGPRPPKMELGNRRLVHILKLLRVALTGNQPGIKQHNKVGTGPHIYRNNNMSRCLYFGRSAIRIGRLTFSRKELKDLHDPDTLIMYFSIAWWPVLDLSIVGIVGCQK